MNFRPDQPPIPKKKLTLEEVKENFHNLTKEQITPAVLKAIFSVIDKEYSGNGTIEIFDVYMTVDDGGGNKYPTLAEQDKNQEKIVGTKDDIEIKLQERLDSEIANKGFRGDHKDLHIKKLTAWFSYVSPDGTEKPSPTGSNRLEFDFTLRPDI